tara:strand:+ start:14477 stop:14800 length:324 start_codon:yes stop_codon:yes gene_type:complete
MQTDYPFDVPQDVRVYREFVPDPKDRRLKRFDWLDIFYMAQEIEYFAYFALRDRTYDAESVLAGTWEGNRAHKQMLTEALSVLASQPDCPIIGVRSTKASRERYMLR